MKSILAFLFFWAVTVLNVKAQGVRRLMLFAGDTTNVDLQLQRQWLLADSAGVVNRDIWIAVFADARTFRRMYDHHNVDRDEFTMVLMRKDGSEQLRTEKPLPVKELFELIDKPVVQDAGIGTNKPPKNQEE